MASLAHRLSNLANNHDQRELYALLADMLTDLNALKTAINSHTHGGVTAGVASTGAPNANTMGTFLTTT